MRMGECRKVRLSPANAEEVDAVVLMDGDKSWTKAGGFAELRIIFARSIRAQNDCCSSQRRYRNVTGAN